LHLFSELGVEFFLSQKKRPAKTVLRDSFSRPPQVLRRNGPSFFNRSLRADAWRVFGQKIARTTRRVVGIRHRAGRGTRIDHPSPTQAASSAAGRVDTALATMAAITTLAFLRTVAATAPHASSPRPAPHRITAAAGQSNQKAKGHHQKQCSFHYGSFLFSTWLGSVGPAGMGMGLSHTNRHHAVVWTGHGREPGVQLVGLPHRSHRPANPQSPENRQDCFVRQDTHDRNEGLRQGGHTSP